MPRIEPKVSPFIEDYIDETLDLSLTMLILRVHYLEDNRTTTETVLRDVLRKVANLQHYYLVVHEVGDGSDNAEGRPHYHCVFCTSIKIKDVRNCVTKYWSGQGCYMLKKGTPKLLPEHFNYLCKGTGTGSDDGPDIVDRHPDLTDERIAELHGLYWRNNDNFKTASKKRKLTSISEQVFDLCKHLTPPIDRGKIYDIVYGYYKKRILHWNPDYVRKLVYQTQMYLEPSISEANLNMKAYCVGLPFRPE